MKEVKCLSKHLVERCLQRGYTLDEAMSCVVSQDGDMWTIDTDHPAFPREKIGALSFKCVKDCTSAEFACVEEGKCCTEHPDGTNSCEDCMYYTYTASYDCSALSWGVSSTSSQQPHATGSTLNQWVTDGCSSTYKDSTGYAQSSEANVPAAPSFPTACCAMTLSGNVSQYETQGCCGDCPSWPTLAWPSCETAGAGGTNICGQSPFPSASGCRCSPVSIGGVNDVLVAPVTAQRLPGFSSSDGGNTVTTYADTGIMTDKISAVLRPSNTEIAGTNNGTSTGNIPTGPVSFDILFEACWLQTGAFAINQGSVYDISAEWDLCIYADSAPLGGGVNSNPPGSDIIIVFGG